MKQKLKLDQIQISSFLTDTSKNYLIGGTSGTLYLSVKYRCFLVPEPKKDSEEILPETPYRGTSDTICNCLSNPFSCVNGCVPGY